MKIITFFRRVVLLALLFSLTPLNGQTWQSKLVQQSKKGKLTYQPDEEGYLIPDFSAVGYRGGLVELPRVAVVKTIKALPGDNTEAIQAAIDEVGARPLINGIRGTLLLKAGKYSISGSIYQKYDGVVLRGEGEGDDPATSTILFAAGNQPAGREFIYIGNTKNVNSWKEQNSEKINILDDYLPAGTNQLHLASTAEFQVGDQVIVQHDDTQEWLDAIGGGVGEVKTPKWTLKDDHYVPYNRYITKINRAKNLITIDAPLYYGFRRALSQCYVYKLNPRNIIKEVGIENLRLVSDYNPAVTTTDKKYGTYQADEQHAWEGLRFISVENGWARNITVAHFAMSSILLTSTTRCTLDNCKVIDPISIITGRRRYGFDTSFFCQLILFKDCYARNGRHNYISNGTSSASGNVFLRCQSDRSNDCSEGHRRWSNGFLFDNHKELNYTGKQDNTLAFFNRGRWGTSHGWGMVTGVAWNCDLTAGSLKNGHLIVQKPPTGQNFAIGCQARAVDNKGPFPGAPAHVEGTNRAGLVPASLYEAQLAQRKANLTGKGKK